MVEQIEVFRAKLHWLFAGRGCLNTGYTHLALTHLRKGKLVPLLGKAPCLVGGRGEAEPSSLITECLGRVVAWSTLASEVASTEVPEFELLACFQVFKLTEPLTSPSTAPVYLERLAQTFKVPLGSGIEHLVDQFLEHQKIALGLKVAGEPAAISWKRAVEKNTTRQSQEGTFHCGELGSLLCRCVVSPGSTTGIEQNFCLQTCAGRAYMC